MDAHDGVGVIDRPGKHATELRSADAGLEPRDLSGCLANRCGIVLRRPELQQYCGIFDVSRQFFNRAELLLDAGTAARDRLRFFLVVPETWGERLPLELRYLGLALRNVKDAPLAS